MFYVYEWFIKNTGEVIYVGKGTKRRYKVRKHNRLFNEMLKRFECDSRIIKTFESEQEAFEYEYEMIEYYKNKNQCVCNIKKGGTGGETSWWTQEKRKQYSLNNVMKSNSQRKRMKENNPMKNKDVVEKVSKSKRKRVVINGVEYESVKMASKKLGYCEFTISNWCKKGYDIFGNPCRYANEDQKEIPLMKQKNPRITNFKSVIIDGKRYETIKDGANAIGVSDSLLIYHLKRSNKCKGHVCKYDNQQPSQMNFGKSNLEGSTTNK